MAFKPRVREPGISIYTCLTTDTKDTTVEQGAYCYETDNPGYEYRLFGTGWLTTKSPDSSGAMALRVEALPNTQVAIVKSDATAIDIAGLRCHASGTVAIKLTNDVTAVTWTVTAGEIIYGRIVAVMATNTTLTDSQMTGLK
jgi:hypothetical protein